MLNTLSIDRILPNTLKNTLLVLMSSLAIALAAHVQIPLTPVSVTLQDFAVLLIAMLLGWRLASAAVLCYLIEGAAGLPVFANASGFAELIGPAGGYLLAFLPAAAITGYLIERGWGRHVWGIASAGLIGLAVIFIGGLSVLALFVGWQQSITLGLLPFILGDMLKLIFLTTTVSFFR